MTNRQKIRAAKVVEVIVTGTDDVFNVRVTKAEALRLITDATNDGGNCQLAVYPEAGPDEDGWVYIDRNRDTPSW